MEPFCTPWEKQEFPTGVDMDLIYENAHAVFMQIKDLTEEEYYELYPQMKGIPRDVELLDPDEVGVGCSGTGPG